ncbi:MAG: nucleolar RNA-binding Nop10p family protein [Thermoplasmata archaeon]|nr:nucleolar RNA-binding Nop10p family protein [Thermoplasmata archaeon]
MSSRIRRCTGCGRYTLDSVCGCGARTACPVPPKYSPEDRVGAYRRKAVVDSWNRE